jgi:hypothetical protein
MFMYMMDGMNDLRWVDGWTDGFAYDMIDGGRVMNLGDGWSRILSYYAAVSERTYRAS